MAELPASSYAYCEPGDGAVSTRCHFPIRDADGKLNAAHVRNALARLSQSPFGAKARPKVEAAAKELGIGEPAQKAFFDIKAQLMTSRELDAWLAGERPRRVMAVPFYGPADPTNWGYTDGKGRDVDGQYFDERSDLAGPYAALKASRARLVDWHHDDHGVPSDARWMKGSILGRIDMDPTPSEMTYEGEVYEGIAADFWAREGEKRLALVKALSKRNVPIFGSGAALYNKAGPDGHIDEFPMYRWTVSTSPQNTHAVIPPLKALLAADLPFDEVGLDALRAAVTGLDAHDLTQEGLSDDGPAADLTVKAGRVLSAANEAELRRAMEALGLVLAKLVKEPEVLADLLPDIEVPQRG